MDSTLNDLKNTRIEEYTYDLPDEWIAKFPLADREASKLLVYNDGEITERRFADVTDMLQAGQTLVFNDTKVIYARIFFRKATGASIEVFCLEPFSPGDYALNFAAVGRCEWSCMVGNLKKWKDGEISCPFEAGGEKHVLKALKKEQQEGEVTVEFSWDGDFSFSEVLEYCGRIPIPPYLNRDSEEDDKVRYQTVYSRNEGSVAAPTAGLHFSKNILESLKNKGVLAKKLTLHVGAGTFRPVKADVIGGHDMHTEHMIISRDLVEQLYRKDGDVIAVGTTSVRTLESLFWMGVKWLERMPDFNDLSQWEAYNLPTHYTLKEVMGALLQWFDNKKEQQLKAKTAIIILPGYHYRVIDTMFTNFHQPQSTLLLLVAAAIGADWKKVYDFARAHDFRFLSYGDSSFLRIRR